MDNLTVLARAFLLQGSGSLMAWRILRYRHMASASEASYAVIRAEELLGRG